MSTATLEVTEIRGTACECGEAYGEAFEPLMMGFCQQEVAPDETRLAYAKRCWFHIERDAPLSAEFIRGMAAASHLSLAHVVLLTLHEEVAHMAHCTAFAAAGKATLEGNTIVGQNWDWPPSIYPWVGFLRTICEESPNTLTYNMPGLWACAGINDAGLALMWTTTGLFPPVPPEVGVPTYVMVAEILRQKTVEAAVDYVNRVKRAGTFNFLLGDAQGSVAVIEAIPGYVAVERSESTSRANHFFDDEIIDLTKQSVGDEVMETWATMYRSERIADLLRQHHGSITPEVARHMLLDRDGEWPWLHQYPAGAAAVSLKAMTLDSFFAVCEERTLITCRGGREPGPWQTLSI